MEDMECQGILSKPAGYSHGCLVAAAGLVFTFELHRRQRYALRSETAFSAKRLLYELITARDAPSNPNHQCSQIVLTACHSLQTNHAYSSSLVAVAPAIALVNFLAVTSPHLHKSVTIAQVCPADSCVQPATCPRLCYSLPSAARDRRGCHGCIHGAPLAAAVPHCTRVP